MILAENFDKIGIVINVSKIFSKDCLKLKYTTRKVMVQ